MSPEYHFVIVPKLLDPWYDIVWFGCQAKAKEYSSSHKVNVTCSYIGYDEAIAEEQARILQELVTNPMKYNLTKAPDGIAVAALDETITGEAIDFVHNAGVPIITFDSDSPLSNRHAFVSTDNYAFGLELGKVLDQLKPEGGYFGMITGNGPNLVDRLVGVRDRLMNDPLKPTKWKEVGYSPLSCDNNVTYANELMYQYAMDPLINAIIPVGGWPMFDPTLWKDFVDRNRKITTVVADSVDVQLDLMSQGYVNGLVGQLPYQMGEFSATELFLINERSSGQEISMEGGIVLGTHMLEILRVPLTLPELKVNSQYIGNLAFLGYVLFAIVALTSIAMGGWVWLNRKTHVVRVSQPSFLYMICVGTLIMGSALLPLTVDDESGNQHAADVACMSLPWLIAIGFSTTFAALFSKTWRVFRLIRGAERFQRMKLSTWDVMTPYAVLMLANIITLVCWSVLTPLRYVRQPDLGTDDWNRPLSSNGSCRSVDEDHDALPFFIVLIFVNMVMLIMLNVYAYRARHIQTEYAESHYIALVNASLLQASLIGLPTAVLVYDQPVAYYLVLTFLIFITCMAVLGFILYPKIVGVQVWKADLKRRSNSTMKRRMSINRSQESMPLGMRCAVVNPAEEFNTMQKFIKQAEAVTNASSIETSASPGNNILDDASNSLLESVEGLSEEDSKNFYTFLVVFSAMSRSNQELTLQKLGKLNTNLNEVIDHRSKSRESAIQSTTSKSHTEAPDVSGTLDG